MGDKDDLYKPFVYFYKDEQGIHQMLHIDQHGDATIETVKEDSEMDTLPPYEEKCLDHDTVENEIAPGDKVVFIDPRAPESYDRYTDKFNKKVCTVKKICSYGSIIIEEDDENTPFQPRVFHKVMQRLEVDTDDFDAVFA